MNLGPRPKHPVPNITPMEPQVSMIKMPANMGAPAAGSSARSIPVLVALFGEGVAEGVSPSAPARSVDPG
eukprot:scaffold38010_cov34-Tisochrysis_lutea.AAC.2